MQTRKQVIPYYSIATKNIGYFIEFLICVFQIDCVKEFETFFLPQCLVFSNKPPTEVDRKLGRWVGILGRRRHSHGIHFVSNLYGPFA